MKKKNHLSSINHYCVRNPYHEQSSCTIRRLKKNEREQLIDEITKNTLFTGLLSLKMSIYYLPNIGLHVSSPLYSQYKILLTCLPFKISIHVWETKT